MVSVNYLAVVVAAIAAFILGFLWHGPLFGKMWMKLSGITKKDMSVAQKKGMWKSMVIAVVQQLVMAFVVAQFVAMFGVSDIVGALQLTFWIWLGFFAAAMLDSVLWERRSWPLYSFNIVYRFFQIFVMTAVIALWK